ncbi:MAG: ABC transporter permease subunit [Alphaproteobacteria bacterium]|jgi:peptide/nickel transport system permease protein|nr:ABC transporter permease subunit [Alphaproteobacteria bacterium]
MGEPAEPGEPVAALAEPAGSGRAGAWARLTANRMTSVGLAVLGLLLALTALAPVLPLADPDATDLSRHLLPPFSEGAWLGTDQFGRDLLSRLVWGTRVSLGVGLAATLAAALVGATIGLLAAYYGRLVDTLLMRGIDTVLAFPYLLLALAIVAALGPSLLNALMAIAIVNVPFFARAVRGQALAIKNLDYIAAARLSGFSDARIILTEILPNVFPVVVVTMATTLSWMILETAGLSFLGLGAQPPTADLGSMLGNGRELVHRAPWVAVLPGVVILLLAVGINLVSDGVRDVLDPRLKSGVLVRPAALTARRLPDAASAAVSAAPAPALGPDLVLSVRGLSTRFEVGGRVLKAVEDVSFDISRGETLGLVGESGSGKSVTALSLAGLVASPPGVMVKGEVWLNGGSGGPIDLARADLATLQAIRGGRIAYIFQDPLSALNPVLRAGEQVAETLVRHRGLGRGAAMAEAVRLLDAVKLPGAREKARAFPHELSGGQRQRVMIAMALANRPDLLIADEPTTALDVTTQQRVLALLDELRRETGAALLFISHDFAVIGDLCDRVAVMYAGQIVEQGSAAALFARPAHPYTERLLQCVPDLKAPHDVTAIPNLPPAVDRLPPGCSFAPRCHRATQACREAPIALRALDGDHAARCLYAEEVAAGTAAPAGAPAHG